MAPSLLTRATWPRALLERACWAYAGALVVVLLLLALLLLALLRARPRQRGLSGKQLVAPSRSTWATVAERHSRALLERARAARALDQRTIPFRSG